MEHSKNCFFDVRHQSPNPRPQCENSGLRILSASKNQVFRVSVINLSYIFSAQTPEDVNPTPLVRAPFPIYG
jgi:hypothetical protein